jgi:TPR repeat protein/transglutaminase-like putative cysteine protease
MIARFCSALLMLLISSSFVAGNAAPVSSDQGPAWVDPGWRRTVARYAVSFDEQGLSTTIYDFEIQAIDDKGVEAIAQQTIPYNSYFDELSSSELVTLKSDGRVVAVDERAIRDQPASADSSSPYFDERRVRIIAYPHVVPGDRIRGRLVYKSKQPRFAGEFARYWSQAADQPPEMMELTLDGPASKPLHVALRNVEHREEQSGERIIHHVRFRQEQPKPRQTVVGSFDDARRFEVSSFADYAAFAAVLNARNAPMAQPDEALRKLSAEIVGDAADTRLKVERLHNWVARNIRYVGIGFEDGGWTSQPASAVLASHYGDCKAHATILKALLAAQGIEANLVAVNADLQYTLTEVATPNFDHAIVYVPAIDQYVDPTASLLAFGSLPPDLSGKPVLNIDKGTIARIPVQTPDHFTLATDTEYTLAGDGTREARSVLSGTGPGAQLGRAVAQGLETVDRPGVARKMIEQAGLSGTGDYSFPNPRELSDNYAITASFRIDSRVDLGARWTVRLLPLTDPRPSVLFLSTGGATERPFRCRSLEYRETSVLTVPDETNFDQKPAPVNYRKSISGKTAYGTVSGRIEVTTAAVIEGRTVRSNAMVRLMFDAPVCPAEFVAAIKSGWDAFGEFRHGAIGLTPKKPAGVWEGSAKFDEGVNAFLAENYKLAMTRLKPFAENGNARAQAYVGTMYNAGYAVERDHVEANRWFQMAAEQGDAYSQSHIGYAYEYGLGAPRDEQAAAKWYSKAADQGDAYGQARLGALYRDGRGVTQDYQQAFNWFSKAANQDLTWAQLNLGLLYLQGQGVPQDQAKGIALLRQAADRNDRDAQYNLGWVYESGTGVPKDTREAIKWYSKASRRGHQQANAHLHGLTDADSFWVTLLRHVGLAKW